MNQPGLKNMLTQIQRQRATLAKMRSEAESLGDSLTVLEARARDTGERIPMAAVHGRITGGHKFSASAGR